MQYLRVTAHKSLEVPVRAGDVWNVLLDWGALMDWIPKLHEDPPAPVSGCELLPGQSPDNLPCTRRVYLQNEGIGPGHLDETLRHFDAATKRLYYTFEGVGPMGMRNYHATTFVDETGPESCRITCAGQFDMPTDAGTDMKDFVENFYDRAIIQGITKFLRQRTIA